MIFDIVMGASVLGGVFVTYLLLSLVIAALRRNSKNNYQLGYAAGIKSNDQEVYEHLIQIRALTHREPKVGANEYVADFAGSKSTLDFAKIVDIKDGVIIYRRINDVIPMTGSFIHVGVIVPDSVQEC